MSGNIRSIFAGYFILILVLSCGIGRWGKDQQGSIAPTQLNCEYRSDHAVVDVKHPRLGWVNLAIDTAKRGLSQTAYQIRVASSKEKLHNPDLWDSKKVSSDNSIRVEYDGKRLTSGQECWWQVRVWDQEDLASAWSEPRSWHMGLLNTGDWLAQWIGAPWQGEAAFPRPDGGPNGIPKDFGPPAPMFRKEFSADKEIKKAVAYVTGLGYFELYANGKKVGDDVLVPNQTNYGKRPKLPTFDINVPDEFRRYKVMYMAYDLTAMLKKGQNVLGAIVGNGFYNPAKFWTEGYGTPRFLMQLHITHSDGTIDVITTDESWKVGKSPITMNMVYYGEDYDARLEQPDWCTAGFDDSAWPTAIKRKSPEGELVAHTAYPDKVMERIKPKSVKKLGEGHYQVDFGKEISGWVRFSNITGPKGHRVDISFNGNEYSGDNSYTFSGKGAENYAPRFNWFVFSGIEIKNWPGELKAEQLTAEAVNTYIERNASFTTSNPLLNNIVDIWQRSQEDNMHGGIASDCPHRERSGYTGDGQVACSMVMHNYDARNFYQKWIQDIFEAQIPETGYVPNGAPWQPGCGGGVAWGAAINIMPWDFYLQYADLDMLKETYEGMKGYVDYLKTWRNDVGIVHSQRLGANGEVMPWFNLGEWAPAYELPPQELVHTFYFWLCAKNTAETAQVLGKTDEAEIYTRLAENTKAAFHTAFFDIEKHTYGPYGADVFALTMGVPNDEKEDVVNALKNTIASNMGHLDTGIFGTRYFFEVLSENGLHDLAYEALTKTDFPSFGHWLEQGSTTTREHWNDQGSHNHPMFGGGLVWLYRNLAGMQVVAQHPGYKKIVFKPVPVGDIDTVSYFRETVYGKAGIAWKNGPKKFLAQITVPVGGTAEIYLPAVSKDKITEQGHSLDKSRGIISAKDEAGMVICEVGSGNYRFEVQL